jgi:hypothetical protein
MNHAIGFDQVANAMCRQPIVKCVAAISANWDHVVNSSEQWVCLGYNFCGDRQAAEIAPVWAAGNETPSFFFSH